MDGQGLIVACPSCGRQMRIPPGYENMKGRCRQCGAEVPPAAQPAEDALTFDVPDLTAAPKKKPVQKEPEKPAYGRAIAVSFGWGLLAGAVLGGIAAAADLLLLKGTYRTAGAFTTWGLAGGLSGFALTSTWLLVMKLELEFLMSAIVGGAIAFVMGAVDYFTEYFFVAPPDLPYYYFGAVCLFGGIIFGGFASYMRSRMAGD